jgi:hypothetical protein
MSTLMLSDEDRVKLRQDCFAIALEQAPAGTPWEKIFEIALRFENFFLTGTDSRMEK